LGLAGSCAVHAEEKAPVQERLKAAALRSSLEDVTRPWHLQLQVHVSATKDAQAQVITIDRWQADKDWRTVFNYGDASFTTVFHDGKLYRTGQERPIPDGAQLALDSVLHPGPLDADYAGTKPELRKTNVGKTTLDCIMLSRPIPRVAFAPLGIFPTYCLSNGEHLAISYDYGSYTVVRPGAGTFLDHEIATRLDIMDGQKTVAQASVSQLKTFVPAADEFTPAPELKTAPAGVRLAGGVMAGHIIQKVQPIYPENARLNRASGTVVLKAVIAADGHVRSLEPISAPDPDLVIAAIAAVRQWTYQPFLLNGEPTAITTTITVNFNMTSRLNF
jgi:TonB family protein